MRFLYEYALGRNTLTSKNADCSLARRPRARIWSRASGALLAHFPRNFLENRLHLNDSTHRLQNFSHEISNFVVQLCNIASTHSNHSMVSVKQVPADAHRWDVIEFSTISQLNCVPKLPLVKSEVHFFKV